MAARALILAAVLVLASPGIAAAVPAIQFSGASSAPPGGSVTVTGTGFAANAVVHIYLDGDPIDFSATNGSGSFAANTIRIPASTLPGGHALTAENGGGSGGGAVAGITVRTGWAQGGFGAAGRAFNPRENLLGRTTVEDLEHAWSTPTAGTDVVHGTPIVYNGILYYVIGNDLRAVNLSDHSLRWHNSSLSLAQGASPTAYNNAIYIGSSGPVAGSARLYALNSSTGAELWHATFPASSSGGSAVASAPTASGGVVYLQVNSLNTGGGLFALPTSCSNPCTPLWHSANTLGGYASPSVGDGRVYARPGNGGLAAYPVGCGTGNATCNPEWTGNTYVGTGLHAAPTYTGGRVFAADDYGRVVAFRSDGCPPSTSCAGVSTTVQPSVAAPQNSDPPVAAGGGELYELVSDSTDGWLVAFAAGCRPSSTPCGVAWRAQLGSLQGYAADQGAIAVANGVVYATAGKEVAAFPTRCATGGADCAPLWRGSVGATTSPYLSGPALADGVLYVPSNRVKAFDLPSAGN